MPPQLPHLPSFSSKRLIVKADKLKNIDKKNVIAAYDGYYLLSYGSSSASKKAYVSYSAKANGKSAIAADQPVHMAIGSADAGGLTDVTKKENPLAELKDNVSDITKAEVKKAEKKKVIALLDTGASKSSNVIESVSMLGDSGADDNGHGEAMAEAIEKQNKNAQIISVKVLDNNGEGSVSSIVEGIAYAEKRGASIINMSLSGLATDGNAVVATAVNQAINDGLTVVGATGNNGRDAKYYAVFAKANNNGETIKKGVRFDSKTGAATVSKSAFEKSDFGDLQMEMFVPTSLNKKSTIKVNIENEKGTIIDQATGEVSPYRALTVKLPFSEKRWIKNHKIRS